MSAETVPAGQPDLPPTLPLFPLTGVLLLPRGRLPLNIFEPRYLSLVNDALADVRLIGMVQPVHPVSDPVPGDAEVFATGCAGRIISFSETGDGRYLITLLGVCRFAIGRELDTRRGYRRAAISFRPFLGDLEEAAGAPAPDRDRERRLKAAKSYFQTKNLEVDWDAVAGAGDEAFVTSLAMSCPFGPGEKQALLECAGLTERSDLLVSLLEMAALETGTGDGGARH